MIPTIPGNTSPPVRVQGTDFGRTVARPLALSAAALVPILVALDLAYGALLRTSMPATSREALGAIVLDLAVVLVLVLTLALAQLMAFRVAFWLQQRRGDRVLIVAAVLLSTPVIYLLARQPFIGNRYRGTPVALYGPWVLLPILAAGAALLLWLALRAIRTLHDPATPRGKRTLLLAALGGTALGIFAVDATWYVGWYPLIHTIFSLSVALLLQLIASALLWRRGTPFVIDRRRLAIGGFALAALAAAVPLTWSPVVSWRLVTGTVFGSRALEPALRAMHRDAREKSDTVSTAYAPRVEQLLVPDAVADSALIVTVDALRQQDVGLFNPSASNTPAIDRYFAGGHIFARAYTHYAATRLSLRALLQSNYDLEDRTALDGLVNAVKDHGFVPVALVPNDVRLFVNLEYHSFERVEFYDDPAEIMPKFEALRASLPEKRWLLWVHLYQPHDPYTPPPGLSSGRTPYGRYAGEVRWADQQFGEIVNALPRSASPVVVLGADHGEEFFEHGGTVHGRTLYDETVRVPLLVKVPGLPGGRVSDVVANIDIAPTVLARLGIAPPESYLGYDLFRKASTPPADRVVYMESVTDVVGAVQGTHKWMYSQPTGLWECYDLAADPRELRNLCDSRPDLLRKGQAHVSAYMQRGAEHHAAVAVPVAASVSRDTDLAHANPRVRAAAVQAMVPSAGPVAVAALQEQWANDRSPTVRAAILRTLLEVDQAAAIEALKDETVARRLSDYERVRIIASAQAVEALPHLLDLFREYGDSKQFRRQILKAIVRVQPSVPHRRELLTELRRSVFEPELRAELTELIGAQR